MKYPEDFINKVICGDCLEVMKDIPDKSIDLVLTDPPYGTTRNDWDKVPDLDKLWNELKRIGKDNCGFIMTSAQPFTTDLINSQRELFRYDLVYEKTLGSGFLNAKKMPMRYHEEVLVFYRNLPTYNPIMGQGVRKKGINKSADNGTNYGKRTKFNQEYDDGGKRYPKSIIRFSTGDRTKEQYHPTGKPTELMGYLIKTYSNENSLILDPFMGSGTSCVGAKQLNRSYIGIEISPKYCKIAQERLRQEVLF
jgi:site-specific DNA-methyltransferase (adenine-specific)